MLDARLPLAAELGLIEGPVVVICAPGHMGPDDVAGPLVAVTDLQPDAARLAARGIETSRQVPQSAATAIVCLPRSREAARDRIARAPSGARLLIDGQKTDGIDAILKECRSRGEVGEVISKAHGKLFAFEGDVTDWRSAPRQIDGDWWTAPGVFSADGIDPGSALLAEALPPLSGRVADLGAGWGYLSRAILSSPEVETLDMVEADAAALDCARRNVGDPRAAFHWDDAATWRPAAPLDHVVTNPPFHRGRSAAPDLGRAFIATAAATLSPRGHLWLVANRHLPYERALEECFSEIEELPGSSAYKIYRAGKPRRRTGRSRP